jgi:hypothetical protein
MRSRFRCTEKCLLCNISMHDNINEQDQVNAVQSHLEGKESEFKLHNNKRKIKT